MPSFSVLNGDKQWLKAKKIYVLDTDKNWKAAKKAWVLDTDKNWRLVYSGEKYVELALDFNPGEYHHEDGSVQWGSARQGYYAGAERSGYLFPQNANSFIDFIYQKVPDFGELITVNFVSIAINRGGSGDWGSERTLRLKQTTKTSLTGPDAVNGYCDFRVSGGQGWKWDLQNSLVSYSDCLKDTIANCIRGTNGAKNIFINSDNTGNGSNGSTWSYDYMAVLGAKMNLGITYIPR